IKFTPSLEEIQEYVLVQDGNTIPVYATIPADLLTPVSAYLRIAAKSDYSFLLESISGGEKLDPYKTLKTEDNEGDPLIVSANPDNPVSMFSPTRKPALGINWSIFPDVELFLSFAGDVLDENGMPLLVQEFEYFNNNGLKILMKPRICELLKSRNE
ncbi:4820_t:CDS:2, partial [Entrophospora sp. SA101]